MIEYREWAKGMFTVGRKPSIFDWQGMKLAELTDRAQAICEVAKEGTDGSPVTAFFILEKMVEALKDRYPRRNKGAY